jgi:hypothetical protein
MPAFDQIVERMENVRDPQPPILDSAKPLRDDGRRGL